MKTRMGLILEVVGAALFSYALYTLAPWAGMAAGGVLVMLIGVYLGAVK